MKTPIVIVGIGKSGTAAKNLLLARGLAPESILTFDEKNLAAQLNQWDEIEKLVVGTLVISPGVPLSSPGLVRLKKMGWQITSEINLACLHLDTEIIIGITGSVGKSTVTSLIGEAVLDSDPMAFVGGNLGVPFAQYALDKLTQKRTAKYVVLELSSYQLENCASLKLDYSAITFLSANHLERYASADEYYKTKCNIGSMTKNLCVVNGSSKDLMDYKKFISCSVSSVSCLSSAEKSLIEKSQLIGEHNLDNVALALKLAQQLKLPQTALERMLNFSGLAHRLETVGLFKDVLYINDSKATAMDSVLVAAEAALTKVALDNKLYLLLGGKDKNLPWEDLSVLNTHKNIQFIFFGQCGELAQTKSKLQGQYFSKLETAVQFAQSKALAKDVVLLSPGGTSLDEFKNFEDRGNFFKNLVSKMS